MLWIVFMNETLNWEDVFIMLRKIITQSSSQGLVFVPRPCSKYYFCILTTMRQSTSTVLINFSAKQYVTKHVQRFYCHWYTLALGFNLFLIFSSIVASQYYFLGFWRCGITTWFCHGELREKNPLVLTDKKDPSHNLVEIRD